MAARLLATAALLVALAGCSSSGTPSPARSPARGSSNKPVSSAGADPVQAYVDSVNALCDKLLPKIIKVTHGGSIDVPVRTYLASWPAHNRLLDQFDADVAAVPVPPAARTKEATLAAYVRFADRLDAARLKAAHQGEAAYSKEVRAESGAADDPSITALTAAGFNQSCTAR
jgi:hypothetical protein